MPGCKNETKYIKNARVTGIRQLKINSVCQELEKSFQIEGMIVSHYCPVEKMYIYIGIYPISGDKDRISIENLSENRLCLKFIKPEYNEEPTQQESSIKNMEFMSWDTSSHKFIDHNVMSYKNTGSNIPLVKNISSPPPSPEPIQSNINNREDNKLNQKDKVKPWSSNRTNKNIFL